MKNIMIPLVVYQQLEELRNKQGVNMKDFLTTLIGNLHTEMKKTGRKPL